MIGVPAGEVTPVWQGPIGYTVVGGPVHPDRPTTDSHRSSPPGLHEAPDLWAGEWRAGRHHGRAPLTHRGALNGPTGCGVLHEQPAERAEQCRVGHRERVDLPNRVLTTGLQQLVGVDAHHEPADVEEEVVRTGDANRQPDVFDDDGTVLHE